MPIPGCPCDAVTRIRGAWRVSGDSLQLSDRLLSEEDRIDRYTEVRFGSIAGIPTASNPPLVKKLAVVVPCALAQKRNTFDAARSIQHRGMIDLTDTIVSGCRRMTMPCAASVIAPMIDVAVYSIGVPGLLKRPPYSAAP